MGRGSEGLGEEASVHDDEAKVREDMNDAKQQRLRSLSYGIATAKNGQNSRLCFP